jgi:hypothetical protein
MSGMTAGQLDRFQAYLLEQAAACDRLAAVEALPYSKFYEGQANAFRQAERAARVAAVGALTLAADARNPG